MLPDIFINPSRRDSKGAFFSEEKLSEYFKTRVFDDFKDLPISGERVIMERNIPSAFINFKIFFDCWVITNETPDYFYLEKKTFGCQMRIQEVWVELHTEMIEATLEEAVSALKSTLVKIRLEYNNLKLIPQHYNFSNLGTKLIAIPKGNII